MTVRLAVLFLLASPAVRVTGCADPTAPATSPGASPAASTVSGPPTVETDSLVDRTRPGLLVDVEIPRVVGHDAVSAAIRDSVAAFVARIAPTEGPETGSVVDTYDTSGGYTATLVRDDLVSVAVAVSSYAGGAHPNTYYQGLTWDLGAGRALTADDWFRSGAPYRDTLAAHVTRGIVRQLADDMTADEARAMIAEYNQGDVQLAHPTLVLTPEGVRVLIAPYEVLYYAAGSFEVDVPWAALAGMLRADSPVAGLAQETSDG